MNVLPIDPDTALPASAPPKITASPPALSIKAQVATPEVQITQLHVRKEMIANIVRNLPSDRALGSLYRKMS